MSTLLITHPACLDHLTPAGHPERPDRLRAIDRALGHERFRALVRVEAPRALLETIALCHPMQYVTAVRDASPKEGLLGLDADTTMSPGSFEAALRAAGGAVHAGDEFHDAFETVILPRLRDFRPDLIVISAGFDAHMRDPLANLNLLEADFDWATRKLMEVADACAEGRIVSVLEGGYDLEGLANSASAHVAALMQAR